MDVNEIGRGQQQSRAVCYPQQTRHSPLIGITTHRILSSGDLPFIRASQMYSAAVSSQGGCPVLVPLGMPENTYREMLARLDGLLFTGGGDMNPKAYGSSFHPLVTDIDEDRDRVEIFLYREAVQRKLPFLGICRGLQVLNVMMGGTLFEDIADQHPGALRHDYYPGFPRNTLAHSITITPGSLLKPLFGDQIEVNSLHHQGIRALAPALQAIAHAPDGIIEAVALPDHPFGLAVQWHPEWLQDHKSMRILFCEFVKAAQG